MAELSTDQVIEVMDRLSENSIAVTKVTTELHLLTERLGDVAVELREFRKHVNRTLDDHESRLVDVEHNCRRQGDWNRAWNRIETLEKCETKREGRMPIYMHIKEIAFIVLAAIIGLLVGMVGDK
jgi:hypothetical protein